ncbi:MAG: helix-turn-helix domain-containing protein [Ornithinimicrobium sp.]|uniref:helix-turn-helix transcriptional regulator n=1 Tax=Ornithinimicrobium sp. TaxID=1977084 RepID=UPI0026DF38DF|nr:helix-turn-helix domain-containing protein [Ornithinimicrobium sp.]MDO5741035.1 helix-turn-helix domain-containing protein [Ornithinimicrobium sp.]
MFGTSKQSAITGVAALAEPVRRRLYEAVATAPGSLGREAAAEVAGVPVHTAKFHLDKLVDAGLLEVEFRRLTGRTGPGSGRPAKLYRRAEREIHVELPARQYDLLSRILARAVARSDAGEERVAEVAGRVAREEGVAMGESRASSGAELKQLCQVLTDVGYEPQLDEDQTVRLLNCPFHHAAREQTDLVCGLNLEYVSGVRDGMGCTGVATALDPGPCRCCVSLRQT